jgi:hypothetical protein
MREAFKRVNFAPATLAVIQQCNAIIREYREQGLRLTLRQLYYQFVSRDCFPPDRTWSRLDNGKWVRDPNGTPNADPNYKWLGSVLNDGRLAGLIDWSAIEDRGRRPRASPDWPNIQSLVESALASYRLPRWKGQSHYAELWVEKDALAGVLEPLASRFHVTLMVNRGYSSQSAMYESARRFIQACMASREDNGDEAVVGEAQYEGETVELVRTPTLFYLGDHDPSGEDMVRDIRDRLAMFGINVRVEKVALTTAQVRQFNPPENPVKFSDSRAEAYVAKHGKHCWEVDALPPDELARIIRRAFTGIIDKGMMDVIMEREKVDKERLRHAARNLGKKTPPPPDDEGPEEPPTRGG